MLPANSGYYVRARQPLPAGQTPFPITPRSPPRIMNSSNPPIILVEAVFLVTTVVESPTLKFCRPIYVSPSVTSASLLKPENCNFEDVLHIFCGTCNRFEVLFRFAGSNEIVGARLFSHEASIVNTSIESLVVINSGDIVSSAAEAGAAFLMPLPERRTFPELSQTKRRLQIFDQERHLLFTKEWEIDVGILNDDAISWLHKWDCTLEHLRRTNFEPTSPFQQHQVYSAMPGEHFHTGSISASFINLDDRTHSNSTASRSDSMITIQSHLEDSHDTTKTVDFLHQVGFWIYGTRVGQMIASYDPSENLKTFYSRSPVWLLGKKFVNDQIEAPHLKVILVDPITHIIDIKGLDQKLKISRLESDQLSADSYYLRECLIISFYEIGSVIARIASWLESSKWDIHYNRISNDVIRFEAVHPNGCIKFEIRFTLLTPDRNNFLVDCQMYAPGTSALRSRTIFVDIIAQLLTICGTDSIEFVFLETQGSQIEIGPHPSSIVQLVAASEPDKNQRLFQSLEISILLWSEHIHDWISRQIRRAAKVGPHIDICSAELPIEHLSLDISQCSLYFFADSSLRFAISYSGTWLCFKSLTQEDFYILMRWFPFLLSTSSRHEAENVVRESGQSLTYAKFTSPLETSVARQSGDKAPGLHEFLAAFECRFWFTYRKDFARLAPSILSSDAGFGCMIRAGQSMMAEALARVLLGDKRHLNEIFVDPASAETYKTIISLFMDVPNPKAVFSIHNLVLTGADLGTPIGQYFSPSVLARVLRKQCKRRLDIPCSITIIKQGIIDIGVLSDAICHGPQVILIPLRLGADTLNEEYAPLIKASLSCSLSIGIIGGRTNRAFYIVGFQDDSLLYLDPHNLRNINLDSKKIIETQEYHTKSVCELLINQLDPTILLGFLCETGDDVHFLKSVLSSIPVPMPLFSFG